jgi:long-chain acyl-CoA synthetase
MKTEGIEALVYPSPDFFASNANEAAASPKADIKARIERIIAEVNQRLLPYQRIERITLLDKPMEMTTTKKIKREAV